MYEAIPESRSVLMFGPFLLQETHTDRFKKLPSGDFPTERSSALPDDLRFQNPCQPATRFSGVFVAFTFPASCGLSPEFVPEGSRFLPSDIRCNDPVHELWTTQSAPENGESPGHRVYCRTCKMAECTSSKYGKTHRL